MQRSTMKYQVELQEFNEREAGKNIGEKEVKIMVEKPIETAESNSWKLRNSRQTAVNFLGTELGSPCEGDSGEACTI